ncbi:hypothetical protein BDR26DRAFT_1005797 [Obelidium mucronatum]|nr:hypothetical protein BDR26DRAFT_1005797 [Obelidium mucronatum]
MEDVVSMGLKCEASKTTGCDDHEDQSEAERPSVILSDYDLGGSSSSLLVAGVQKLKATDMRKKLAKDSSSVEQGGPAENYSSYSVDSSHHSLDGKKGVSPKVAKKGKAAVTRHDSLDSNSAGHRFEGENSRAGSIGGSKDNVRSQQSSNSSLIRRGEIRRQSKDGFPMAAETSPRGTIKSISSSSYHKESELEQVKSVAAQMKAQIELLMEQNRKLTLALESRDRYNPHIAIPTAPELQQLASLDYDFASTLQNSPTNCKDPPFKPTSPQPSSTRSSLGNASKPRPKSEVRTDDLEKPKRHNRTRSNGDIEDLQREFLDGPPVPETNMGAGKIKAVTENVVPDNGTSSASNERESTTKKKSSWFKAIIQKGKN